MSAGGAIQKGGGGAAASGEGAASEAGQSCLPGAAVCRRGPPDRAGHQVPRLQEPQEEGRRVHAHGLRLWGALLLRVWGGPLPRCPVVVCCGCSFPPWPLSSRLSAEALASQPSLSCSVIILTCFPADRYGPLPRGGGHRGRLPTGEQGELRLRRDEHLPDVCLICLPHMSALYVCLIYKVSCGCDATSI